VGACGMRVALHRAIVSECWCVCAWVCGFVCVRESSAVQSESSVSECVSNGEGEKVRVCV